MANEPGGEDQNRLTSEAIDQLGPPNEATCSELETKVTALESLPSTTKSSRRWVDVFEHGQDGVTLEVRAGSRIEEDGSTLSSLSFVVRNAEGEVQHSFVAGDDIDKVEHQELQTKVDAIATSLSEEKGSWLREAWRETGNDEMFLGLAIERLLDDTAYDSSEVTQYRLSEASVDSPLSVRASWVKGDEADQRFKEPAADPIRGFRITDRKGTRYEYSRFGDGRELLRITDPVFEGAAHPAKIGSPEQESLKVVTEGKMKQFNGALQEVADYLQAA